MKPHSKYHYYFIDQNLSTTNAQDLAPGPRILKVKASSSSVPFKYSDGPYLSIRKLKRYSIRFKQYQSNNTKRAQKICNEKWIKEITSKRVYSTTEESVPIEFLKSIEHIVTGSVKKGQVSGIHFVDPEKVMITEVVNQNQQGVFEAKFKVFDHKTQKWFEKELTSTFFPESWSLNQLFHECFYAYIHCSNKPINGKINLFKSTTKSGVKVAVVLVGEKVKTIYPML